MPSQSLHEYSLIIGRNLRALRESRGMTQSSLGQALGLSFQQIQKYERGENVISAVRLHRLSQILDASLEAFFEGIYARPAPSELSGAVHPAIMERALKIQNKTEGLARAKVLKIIDTLTA